MSRSGLWIVAAGVAGFVAAITYWVIALAVAESHRADMVAPERVTGFIQAVIDANRANYTQNVVDKLHNQGVVEALEHWKEEKGL
ncbi:MAG: Tll0287-like domain-containing protein, partial [Nitrospira sp.]